PRLKFIVSCSGLYFATRKRKRTSASNRTFRNAAKSVFTSGMSRTTALTNWSLRPLRSYWVGCALVVTGGLVLSLGILCLRAASASDAWQYLFWRGIGFGCSVSLLAAW